MKYNLILILCLLGCKSDKLQDYQPFVMEYFPLSGIETSTVRTSNGNMSLFINDELQGSFNRKNWNLWSEITIVMPDKYQLQPFDGEQKVRSFRGNEDIITIQLIQDNTDDAFDFFIEIYNHANQNEYDFDLISCEHFNTATLDFVIYDLILGMDGEVKHILGCILMKRETVFYDIGLVSKDSISNADRYHFTEIINSLNNGDKAVIPYSSEIVQWKSIEVE